jgi:hypothetical protein
MSAVVIVTRFSIRYKGVLPSEEWVGYRFDLLKRTSLPSLSQQTVQNLAWVLSTAPEWYDYVSDLFQSVTIPKGVIKVIPQGAGPESLQDIHPGVEEFITFRFDSDDALASRAIERVLAASAQQGDGEVLFNLPSGIQLDWKTGEMFYRTFRSHYQGPFLAVKNVSRARMLTIGGHHRKTRDFFRVVDVPGLNWVQVVHRRNIRNKIRKNVQVAMVLKWAVEVFRGPQALTADLRRVPRHLHQDLLAEFGIQR